MTITTFNAADHPRAKSGKFEEKAQGAPEVELTAGPSTINKDHAVGYSVSESRMSRKFIAVEDRPAYAERFAAGKRAEGLTDEYASTQPRYWMRQFEAYDIFEAEAPADYTDLQRQAFNDVSLEKMNLDLDHQSFYYNAFTVGKNEKLAYNTDGPYRNHANPERKAMLDEYWGARAARLTEVREQLEALQAAAQADADAWLAANK